MAILSRHWMTVRARRFPLWSAGMIVALAGMFCVASDAVWAAPVTFRFDGVIGPPRDGMSPIDLPFSFAEGDRITGSFTFEPFDAPSHTAETLTIQNAVFRFEVDSFVIETSRYELRALNDSTSDENPEPEDRIDFRCSFGGDVACIPQSIPGSDKIEWAFFAAFGGGGDVLDGPDLPIDPATWNELLPGSLLVTFSDSAIRKSNGFVAAITSIQIVPEPQSGAIALMFGMLAFVLHRAKPRESVIDLKNTSRNH